MSSFAGLYGDMAGEEVRPVAPGLKVGNHGAMSVRIPFGESDGRMFGPMEVPNGGRCGCVCPACSGPLIAYQRGGKKPYFGHKPNAACEGAAETALHRMAKQIVAESAVFEVPEFHVRETAYVGEESATEAACVCKRGRLIVDDSALEQATADGALRPDVRLWGVIEGTEVKCELWVEIAVSHPVDNDKASAMQADGIRCIEIELDPKAPLVDHAALVEQIRGPWAFTHWISHPRVPKKRAEAQRMARERAEQRHQQAAERVAAEQRKRDAREAAHRAELEHAHQLRSRVLDILAAADWINLPKCEAKSTIKRGRIGHTASRVVRAAGAWRISGVERLPLEGPQTAHIGLHGPEGKLWIVLSTSLEPLSGNPSARKTRREATVRIDLRAIEHPKRKKLSPQRLEHHVIRAVSAKWWIDHPDYSAAKAATEDEVQAELKAQKTDSAPRRPRIPRKRDPTPEERRAAIRYWCSRYRDPDET